MRILKHIKTNAIQNSASAIALSLLVLCELLSHAFDLWALQHGAWAAMVTVAIFSLNKLTIRELFLISVSVLVSLMLYFNIENPFPIFIQGLEQARFLMVFIILMGLLHDAAATSRSIIDCGNYMAVQPPARRYFALNGGSATLAVLFNVGILSMMVPLIQKGVQTSKPDNPLNPIRERRQIVALHRGFAWALLWSPTAIAPLILQDLIGGVDRLALTLWGLGIFVIIMCIGAFEDYWFFRHIKLIGPRQVQPFPIRSTFYFVCTCSFLILGTIFFSYAMNSKMIWGLLFTIPILSIGWIILQCVLSNEPSHLIKRAETVFRQTLPNYMAVSITLACSGFIGKVSAAYVATLEIIDETTFDAIPDFIILMLIPGLIIAGSFLALSTIMTAVFLGTLFGSLANMPVDPTMFALAASAGWAISMTLSPLSTIVIILNRLSGIQTTTLSFRWNIVFSLAGMAAITLFFLIR